MEEAWLKALKKRQPGIMGNEGRTEFAVLLPLLRQDDAWQVLFEVRAAELRKQPGEICFPGGRLEPEDQDPWQGALRETSEELGLRPDEITYIAPLDVMAFNADVMLYPFLGIIQHPQNIVPQPEEVASVFHVPLSYLYNYEPQRYTLQAHYEFPPDFPFDLIPNGKNYRWRAQKHDEYFYRYADYNIWGLTARILKHFLDLVRSSHQCIKSGKQGCP